MLSKRRAWLSGWLKQPDNYEHFLQRLVRSCQGKVVCSTTNPSAACLTVQREEDLFHARALCNQFNVCLVSVHYQWHLFERPVLFIDYEKTYSQTVQLESDVGLLIVDANVPLSQVSPALVGSGWYLPFSVPDRDLSYSFSQWYEDNTFWLNASFDESALLAVEALSANGEGVLLGEFGVESSRALQSDWQRQWVSDLFRLVGETDFLLLQASSLGYYRLEEWSHYQTAVPNLARLVLSARRSLFWCQRFYIKLSRDDSTPLTVSYEDGMTDTSEDGQIFNEQVKTIIDPWGIFMNLNEFNTT